MYSVERNGFTDVWRMLVRIEDDLRAASYEIVTSAKAKLTEEGYKGQDVALIVKPTIHTDRLYNESSWCIVFKAAKTEFRYDVQSIYASDHARMDSGINGGSIHVYVTTMKQIVNFTTGDVAYDEDFPGKRSGSLNSEYSQSINWQNSSSVKPSPDSLSGSARYNTWVIPFIEWFMGEEAVGMGHTIDHDGRPEHPHPLAAPSSYFLSVTNHGLYFSHWKETELNRDNHGSWFLVQRPVNEDGNILDIGKAPVVCLYYHSNRLPVKGVNRTYDAVTDAFVTTVDVSVNRIFNRLNNSASTAVDRASANSDLTKITGALNNVYFNKFIVCERDVFTPSRPRDAWQDTEDSTALVNSSKQTAITESNKYTISFPNAINTQRFAYADMLDMVGFTSSDVLGQSVDIDLEKFGGIMRYRAMNSSMAYSTGMRVMALVLQQFTEGYDKNVVDALLGSDYMYGGGNIPEANPFGKPPRTQADLGYSFENTNLATFDPDTLYSES